nr:hypothetical protein [Halapricum sp. CBA1109]
MSKSSGGIAPPSEPVEPVTEQASERETDESAVPLSRDETFEILSNQRRRFALHHLYQNGERADLGDLSEAVAAWENGISLEEVSSAERKRVYTSLQQFHLPKMDEKGIVTFDDRKGVIELTDRADNADVYLEIVPDRDVPWSQYYLGLSSVNVVLLVGALLGVYPLTLVPPFGWGLFVATSVLVSALVHTYYSRTEMQLGSDAEPPEIGD